METMLHEMLTELSTNVLHVPCNISVNVTSWLVAVKLVITERSKVVIQFLRRQTS